MAYTRAWRVGMPTPGTRKSTTADLASVLLQVTPSSRPAGTTPVATSPEAPTPSAVASAALGSPHLAVPIMQPPAAAEMGSICKAGLTLAEARMQGWEQKQRGAVLLAKERLE